jgi:GntR family transcriptional regulator/MocR family aminotransferase
LQALKPQAGASRSPGAGPTVHVDAGFHAVAHLSAGADEQAIISAARKRDVGLYGMSKFRSDGRTTLPELVFGFGNTSQRAIRAGIAAIADLLA